jgi:dTDP-4-dehydrorhamnose reductase
MRILLLGKNGQVGWELQRSLAPLGTLIALDARSPDYCGDLNDLDGLAATIARITPDVIVNAAAYTAVDLAEREPEVAHRINAGAVSVLAREAQKLGSLLVHYSTDYVFAGHGNTPWKETDATAPINRYGTSKLEGERAIQATGCRHLIFRTSWVYGSRGENFAKTIIRLARERERLSVISDQFGSPTGAELLADITAHAIRFTLQHPDSAGLYHLAADGETTWFDYARFVLQQAQALGLPLKVSSAELASTLTRDYPTPAQRPHNSRLNTQKLRESFAVQLPDWRIGLTRMLKETIENAL